MIEKYDASKVVCLCDGFHLAKGDNGQIVFNYHIYNDDGTVSSGGHYVVKHMTEDDINWVKQREEEDNKNHKYKYNVEYEWDVTFFPDEDCHVFTNYKYIVNNDNTKGIEIINDKTGEIKFYKFDKDNWVYISEDGDKLYEALIYSDCSPIRGFLVGFVREDGLVDDWHEDLVEDRFKEYLSDTIDYIKSMNVKY